MKHDNGKNVETIAYFLLKNDFRAETKYLLRKRILNFQIAKNTSTAGDPE